MKDGELALTMEQVEKINNPVAHALKVGGMSTLLAEAIGDGQFPVLHSEMLQLDDEGAVDKMLEMVVDICAKVKGDTPPSMCDMGTYLVGIEPRDGGLMLATFIITADVSPRQSTLQASVIKMSRPMALQLMWRLAVLLSSEKSRTAV